MPHPSELPDNADIVEEVRALAHRVLAAIKHLDPTRYHNIWEQGGLHASREALVVGEFVLTCKPDQFWYSTSVGRVISPSSTPTSVMDLWISHGTLTRAASSWFLRFNGSCCWMTWLLCSRAAFSFAVFWVKQQYE